MENRRCVVGIRLNGHILGSDDFQTILQEFYIECDLQFLSFNRGFKFYLTGAGLIDCDAAVSPRKIPAKKFPGM